MNFSEWVRHIRLERKMDMRAFAEQVGVDSGNLSRIENARIEVTLITTARICTGLGVSPSLLLQMLYDKPMLHLEIHTSLKQKVMPTVSDISAFLQCVHGDWRSGYTVLTDLLNKIASQHTPIEGGLKQDERQLFVPQDIRKFLDNSPFYHFGLYYPTDLKPDHIWDLYRNDGFLQETDVGSYLKSIRQEKQMSLVRLQNMVKVSDSTLSRLESGALERVKLTDAMTLDEQLGQEGKVLVLCLQVCHFNTMLTHLLTQNKRRNQETTLFLEKEKEMHLIDLFTTICRWLLQDNPHENGWIDELREKLAQYVSDEETVRATGEIYKG